MFVRITKLEYVCKVEAILVNLMDYVGV